MMGVRRMHYLEPYCGPVDEISVSVNHPSLSVKNRMVEIEPIQIERLCEPMPSDRANNPVALCLS